LIEPPHGDLAKRLQIGAAADTSSAFLLESLARHRTPKASPFQLPPVEDPFADSLPAGLQHRKVEIQHLLELGVETRVIGSDAAIGLVVDPRLDRVTLVRRIPAKITVPFPSVAVLPGSWLALSSLTGAEEIPVFELVSRESTLAPPVSTFIESLRIRPMQ
jgi:hypothetical protein